MTTKNLQALFLIILCAGVPVAYAGMKWDIDSTRWISLGAGLRSSFRLVENGAPDGESLAKDFDIDNAEIYLSGQVTRFLKVDLNTEMQTDGEVHLLDAVVRLEFKDSFNIWAGRFTLPSDRSNLSGPFYISTFDYPFVSAYPTGFEGRDDGVAVWGDLRKGKIKYMGGVFRGLRAASNREDNLLYTGRFSIDLWDPEPGYYPAGTYYGEKNILSFGMAAMYQKHAVGSSAYPGDFTGWNADGLLEKKGIPGGVVTLETAYYRFYLGSDSPAFPTLNANSYFVQLSYLIARDAGPGRFQPHIRYQRFDSDISEPVSQTDVGVHYVIRAHDLRASAVYTIRDANASRINSFLLGIQIQL